MARVRDGSGENGSPEKTILKFAADLIRRKAWELASRPGFCPTDRDDIEQELRLILLRRLEKFDPAVAHYNAFVTMVIERHAATILEHRAAKSRSHRRCGGSLSRSVNDGEGNQVEFGATLAEEVHSRRTGVRFRSLEERRELQNDVDALIASLPRELADICRRLKQDTISGVARDLGMSRSKLTEWIQRVRQRFEKWEMREYL
jgi:RNA polymerase sigma-70 factor (ECF subfamily)